VTPTKTVANSGTRQITDLKPERTGDEEEGTVVGRRESRKFGPLGGRCAESLWGR